MTYFFNTQQSISVVTVQTGSALNEPDKLKCDGFSWFDEPAYFLFFFVHNPRTNFYDLQTDREYKLYFLFTVYCSATFVGCTGVLGMLQK